MVRFGFGLLAALSSASFPNSRHAQALTSRWIWTVLRAWFMKIMPSMSVGITSGRASLTSTDASRRSILSVMGSLPSLMA